MKQSIRILLLTGLLGFSSTSFALSESEAEDLADLTAVFVYLKMIVAIRIYRTRRFAKRWSFCSAEPLGFKQLQQLQHESAG